MEHVDKKRSSHDSIRDVLPDPRPAREKRPTRNRTAGSLPRVLSRSPTYGPGGPGGFSPLARRTGQQKAVPGTEGKSSRRKAESAPNPRGRRGKRGGEGRRGEPPRALPAQHFPPLPQEGTKSQRSTETRSGPHVDNPDSSDQVVTASQVFRRCSQEEPHRAKWGQPADQTICPESTGGVACTGGGGGPPRDLTHPSRWHTHRMVSMIS